MIGIELFEAMKGRYRALFRERGIEKDVYGDSGEEAVINALELLAPQKTKAVLMEGAETFLTQEERDRTSRYIELYLNFCNNTERQMVLTKSDKRFLKKLYAWHLK